MNSLYWVYAFLTGIQLSVAEPVKFDPIYLSRDAIDVRHEVAPPPAPGSEQDEQDLAEVLELQRIRTEAQCERARAVAKNTRLEAMFGPATGILSRAEVEKLEGFMNLTFKVDVAYFSQKAKKYYERPRPPARDARIHPCVPGETSFAYPSGHSSAARAMALVLSEIFPGSRMQLLERAHQIAGDRVLGGVHHPSDTRAGMALGEQIFHLLMENSRFQADLARAKGSRQRQRSALTFPVRLHMPLGHEE